MRADLYPFSKQYHLRTKTDFEAVKNHGRRIYSKQFLIVIAAPLTESSRIGITITRKVDKRAVRRNLLKRRIREVFRLNRHRLRENFDMIIIARHNASGCSYQEIERQLLGALRYHGYIR